MKSGWSLRRPASWRARLTTAAALSATAHGALLVVVLTLLKPDGALPNYAPPDEPALIVQVVPPPRLPSAPAPRRPPAKRIVAHVPAQIFTTPTEIRPGASGSAVVAQPAAPAADQVTPQQVTRALRSGLVGCANAERVGMNRAERTRCADLFGQGMAAMQAALQRAEKERLSTDRAEVPASIARGNACRAYREGVGAPPRLRDGIC